MEGIEKIFALIQWEDLFFNVIDTCNILAPRKDGCDYRCGDYIKAKFHGKIYKAIICDLDEDKTKLVSLRDDHVQRNQLKYKYLPEDERSSFVADPLPDGNQSICTAATSKRVNEETDSMEEASGIKLTPKRPRVINANTLIQSADLLPLNDQDEVQKVAKTTKMKKAVEKERKKQTDLASELVLLSNKEQLFGSQMNQEDRFNQLEQKIDDLKEVVESFMSCRQCLRKAYKGICNPTPSTPQSSSGAGIKTSGLTRVPVSPSHILRSALQLRLVPVALLTPVLVRLLLSQALGLIQ
ncbi:uncharacterized protein [Argopecten irradians]|uniref:uncharacterized protein n=1 Tax=Argopecten irradians TaxID=31199 RepID=UPI003718F461